MDRREEIELFIRAGEFEASALELALSIPVHRRGPIETKSQKTSGPLRELLREVICRLQEEDPCELSHKACVQIKQADDIYWGVVLQWDRMVTKETWGKPEQEDLVQIARYGMYRACLRFDPSKGYRFSTYARNWMDQAIRVHLSEDVSSIRVVRRDQESRAKLYQARLFLEKKYQRDVSWEEAADWVGMGEGEYSRALAATMCSSISLDASVEFGDEGSCISMKNTLKDPGEDPEGKSLLTEMEGLVEASLESLNENERFVIEKNLLAADPLNYREIGEVLGLSRERVRQIRVKAIGKLRKQGLLERN